MCFQSTLSIYSHNFFLLFILEVMHCFNMKLDVYLQDCEDGCANHLTRTFRCFFKHLPGDFFQRGSSSMLHCRLGCLFCFCLEVDFYLDMTKHTEWSLSYFQGGYTLTSSSWVLLYLVGSSRTCNLKLNVYSRWINHSLRV